MGAATALFVAGTVLAIAQPGDLGDDDDVDTAQEQTTTTSEATTTTVAPTTSAGETTLTTTTGTPSTGASTTLRATTTTTAGAGGTTTSTTIGSGLGVGGNGSTNPDSVISDTGGESWIGVGLGLLGLGLVTRRLTRPQTT